MKRSGEERRPLSAASGASATTLTGLIVLLTARRAKSAS
jgi:hypothetical protein